MCSSDLDPTPDLRGALKPVLVQHMAAITDPKRFGDLLRAIESYKGMPITRAALQLAPLVFLRPGELRKAESIEFDLFLEQRRKMLQTWADYLDKLRTGAEIIPIKRSRIRSAGRTPSSDKMR